MYLIQKCIYGINNESRAEYSGDERKAIVLKAIHQHREYVQILLRKEEVVYDEGVQHLNDDGDYDQRHGEAEIASSLRQGIVSDPWHEGYG